MHIHKILPFAYMDVTESLAKEILHVKVESLKESESMKRKLKEKKQSERKTMKNLHFSTSNKSK